MMMPSLMFTVSKKRENSTLNKKRNAPFPERCAVDYGVRNLLRCWRCTVRHTKQ